MRQGYLANFKNGQGVHSNHAATKLGQRLEPRGLSQANSWPPLSAKKIKTPILLKEKSLRGVEMVCVCACVYVRVCPRPQVAVVGTVGTLGSRGRQVVYLFQ